MGIITTAIAIIPALRYQVSMADEKYGNVAIQYFDSVEDYFVHADFKRAGETVLTLESPSGEKTEYDLSIEKDIYKIKQRYDDVDCG